jgi:transcriptional regulator with XRE-family HTH domain
VLVQELTRRQRAEGWTDKEMAEHLGVSREFWGAVRRGARSPSVRVLRGALATWPDLATATLAYLQERQEVGVE